jgi:hypothetical protein
LYLAETQRQAERKESFLVGNGNLFFFFFWCALREATGWGSWRWLGGHIGLSVFGPKLETVTEIREAISYQVLATGTLVPGVIVWLPGEIAGTKTN